eukprot:g3074.t1
MAMAKTNSLLFSPLQLGQIGMLRHRIVLAPLTRNRANNPLLVPSDLAVDYYRQRASTGGLLITEATYISPESMAYPNVPGIWSREQVEGWKKVTSAVHEKNGYIVCQLWHCGRVAHPSYAGHPISQSSSLTPCVSSSANCIVTRRGKPGKTLTYDEGIQDYTVPRALPLAEIPRLIQNYIHAAKCAKEAGFDGVELHAAHGYLIDQFINNGVNHRTDRYGGSVNNRCRLLFEVIDALQSVWGEGKVGCRLSPHENKQIYYGCRDSNPDLVYQCAIEGLNERKLAYLLITEPRWSGKYDANYETDPSFSMPIVNLRKFRHLYQGCLIGSSGFVPSTAEMAVDQKDGYDCIAFGRWFISNPDLPEKLYQRHLYLHNKASSMPKLNVYDRSTFYADGEEGYIDYPSLAFEKGRSHDKYMEVGKYKKINQEDVGSSLKLSKL